MASYVGENEAKNLKMAMFILLKFLTLEWDISRTTCHIEVSNGSFNASFVLYFFTGVSL